MRTLLLLLLISLISLQPAHAQLKYGSTSTLPKYEFRGTWIASVANLDWPSSQTATTAVQKAELISMLDKLKATGINAVFFQIRPECDALYESSFEPWSIYLTGTAGKAPDPFYDPLAFAIEEAHRRGMELHAWFNPFRAVRNQGSYAMHDTHVSVQHPEWLITINGHSIINPGIPDVRDYVVSVVMDVVNRYDVDGVHFDDYFYPYPPNQISNEDKTTFETYNDLGFSSIGTWRTYNVNIFVKEIWNQVKAAKPHVKFGISPFGIWKSGVPAGINGLSAVDVLFADAVNWMEQEWVDYLAPQLYWQFGGGQDYGKLAPWWASVSNNRHIYTGHGLYRSDPSTFGGTKFSANEVPRQVRFNREQDGIQGSVFFRAKNLTNFPSKGFADSLKTDLYRHAALTPPLPWADQRVPAIAENVTYAWQNATELKLTWDPPTTGEGQADARRFAIYRVRSSTLPNFAEAILDPVNFLTFSGETTIMDSPEVATEPYYYFVTSVSNNSIESDASDYVLVEGRAVSTETEPTLTFALHQNYPNPFRNQTEIGYSLDQPGSVTLQIYDLLGRRVTTLVNQGYHGTGVHTLTWDGTDQGGGRLSSGNYFAILEVDGRRITKPMILIR